MRNLSLAALALLFVGALPAGASSSFGEAAPLLAAFVARLESQDPFVTAADAAQSLSESQWEAARQVWTTYDPIEVDEASVTAFKRTGGDIVMDLELRARGHVPGTKEWVALPGRWKLRYAAGDPGPVLKEAQFGQNDLFEQLTVEGPWPDIVNPSPLTLALLRKYVTTEPPMPNANAVAHLTARLAMGRNDAFSRVMGLQAEIVRLRRERELDAALEAACESLILAEQTGVPDLIASSRYLLGNLYSTSGDLRSARDHFIAIAGIQPALRDQSIAVDAMGRAASQEPGELLKMQLRAESAAKRIGYGEGAAMARYRIGVMYSDAHYYDLALAAFASASTDLAAAGRSYLQAIVLLDTGVAQFATGRLEKALKTEMEALSLMKPSARTNRSSAMDVIGSILWGQGRLREAGEFFNSAMAIANESGDHESMYWATGTVGGFAMANGDYTNALEHSRKALELAPDDREVTRQRGQIGRALYCLGRFNEARRELDQSISLLEALRVRFPGDEQAATRYFTRDNTEPYHDLVDLSLDEGHAFEALQWLERLKGRTLQDAVQYGKVDLFRSMSGQERATERKLNEGIVAVNRRLMSAHDPRLDRKIHSDLEAARLGLERFRAELFLLHPEIEPRRVAGSENLDVDEILRGKNVLVLSYLVKDHETLLFAIDSSPAGVTMEIHRIQISREALTARVNELAALIEQRSIRFAPAARGLWLLLIAPVEARIGKHDALCILPDDILWRIPFGVLQGDDGRALVEITPLYFSPSLTMLRSGPSRPREGATAFLGIANPDFGKHAPSPAKAGRPEVNLAPLPEAEEEIRVIGTLYGPQNSRLYTGARATEELIKRDAGGFKILHFATHALVSDEQPMYSSLVLAQSGDGKEDGLLEAREILDLKLNADIVVLSACETARGGLHNSEGVIGMSWALRIAGCPTTVVSQWMVVSDATQRLMIEFHRHLRNGNTPAEALRRAEMAMMKSGRYSHPYYWAPFIVVGLNSPLFPPPAAGK